MPGSIFRKKRPSVPQLILTGADGRELYHDRLDAFPFPEEEIVAGSIEFFQDPAPCEIHRRAVELRFCGEMTMLIPANRTLKAEDLPVFPHAYWGNLRPALIRLETDMTEEEP